MAEAKIVKSVRLDRSLDERVKAYAAAAGVTEAEGIRQLLEKGLACESLSLFATPVGSLIRTCIEAEFSLLRSEISERNDELEDRLARVCSRGTKASLQAAAQINDVSRAIIPAWQAVDPVELFDHYSRIGGEMQRGSSYKDARGCL